MGPPRFHCATSMKVYFIEARFRSSDLWVPHVGDPVGLYTGKSIMSNDGILEIYTHVTPVFRPPVSAPFSSAFATAWGEIPRAEATDYRCYALLSYDNKFGAVWASCEDRPMRPIPTAVRIS